LGRRRFYGTDGCEIIKPSDANQQATTGDDNDCHYGNDDGAIFIDRFFFHFLFYSIQ
jgi:hypothetical protein